jgi:ABC-type branched-subunit amino acid transport system permease subunit
VQRYLDSPLGHMLRAMKSNETRLEYLGMSARRVLLIGYVISAFLGGIGGTLVSIIQQIATPEFEVLVPYLLMVLVLLVRPFGLFGAVQVRKI